MKVKNYPHVDTVCPECKKDMVLHDPRHNITYCEHCGLVIIDNTFTSIITYIDKEIYKEHHIRSLWKK